jgi:hypothetical protein
VSTKFQKSSVLLQILLQFTCSTTSDLPSILCATVVVVSFVHVPSWVSLLIRFFVAISLYAVSEPIVKFYWLDVRRVPSVVSRLPVPTADRCHCCLPTASTYRRSLSLLSPDCQYLPPIAVIIVSRLPVPTADRCHYCLPTASTYRRSLSLLSPDCQYLPPIAVTYLPPLPVNRRWNYSLEQRGPSRFAPLRFRCSPSLPKSPSSSQLFGSTKDTPRVFAVRLYLSFSAPWRRHATSLRRKTPLRTSLQRGNLC